MEDKNWKGVRKIGEENFGQNVQMQQNEKEFPLLCDAPDESAYANPPVCAVKSDEFFMTYDYEMNKTKAAGDDEKFDKDRREFIPKTGRGMKGVLGVAFVLIIGIVLAVSFSFMNDKSGKQDDSGEQDVSRKAEDASANEDNIEQNKLIEPIILRNTLQDDQAYYNGHTYAIFNFKSLNLKSYNETEAFCKKLGGHLAVIESAEENQFLYQYVLDSDLTRALFGYSDEEQEGKWEWVGENQGTYTNWAEGQPNNGANNKDGQEENYAVFSRTQADGTWNDADFGADTYYMICEWDEEIPEIWQSNNDVYDSHRYAIYNYKSLNLNSYDAVEAYCESQGGHLAVIESAEENRFIYQFIVDSGLTLAFFGYSDENQEGEWEWVVGESTYTNWAEGQPNNGANNDDNAEENYAQFSKSEADGTWNDAKFGTNSYYFICEWDYH